MISTLLLLLAATPDAGYPFHAKDPIQVFNPSFVANAIWVDGGRPPPWHGAHWSDATWFQRQGFFECREPIVYWKYDVGGTTYWSYELPDAKNPTRLMMCRDDVPPPPPCPVPCSIGCELRYSVETALCRDGGQW